MAVPTSVCQYLRRGDGIAAFEDSRRKERLFGMRGRTKPMPAGDNEAKRNARVQPAHRHVHQSVCPPACGDARRDRPLSATSAFLLFYIAYKKYPAFFPYDNDGYTETDRTSAAQDYHVVILRYCLRPPPQSPDVYARPIVTTCLYTSALLSVELGSCLHP